MRHLREKTRTSYIDFARPAFKMALPPLTRNKILKNTRQRAHKTKTDHAHIQKATTKCTHLHLVSELKLEVKGVAMGTKMGPNYACLFVGYVERKMFEE